MPKFAGTKYFCVLGIPFSAKLAGKTGQDQENECMSHEKIGVSPRKHVKTGTIVHGGNLPAGEVASKGSLWLIGQSV